MVKKQCPVHPNVCEEKNNPCPICYAFKDIWSEDSKELERMVT